MEKEVRLLSPIETELETRGFHSHRQLSQLWPDGLPDAIERRAREFLRRNPRRVQTAEQRRDAEITASVEKMRESMREAERLKKVMMLASGRTQ